MQLYKSRNMEVVEMRIEEFVLSFNIKGNLFDNRMKSNLNVFLIKLFY